MPNLVKNEGLQVKGKEEGRDADAGAEKRAQEKRKPGQQQESDERQPLDEGPIQAGLTRWACAPSAHRAFADAHSVPVCSRRSGRSREQGAG